MLVILYYKAFPLTILFVYSYFLTFSFYTVLFIVDASRAIDENVIHIMHQLETNLAEFKKQQIEEKQSQEEKISEEEGDKIEGQEGEHKEKERLGVEGKECILVINKVFIIIFFLFIVLFVTN